MPLDAEPDVQENDQSEVYAIKGFDPNLSCRGYQYEIGKTYEHDGDVVACESGFHACQNPLDVFGYYPPGTSRYAAVKQAGNIARHDTNTKIASARITIEAELKLPEVIDRAVKWILARVNWKDAAATNTGDGSAATNTGDGSAATNTGDGSAATNTGIRSAATNTGDGSAATNTGKFGVALASGHEGRVMGADGNALFLVHRDPSTSEIK